MADNESDKQTQLNAENTDQQSDDLEINQPLEDEEELELSIDPTASNNQTNVTQSPNEDSSTEEDENEDENEDDNDEENEDKEKDDDKDNEDEKDEEEKEDDEDNDGDDKDKKENGSDSESNNDSQTEQTQNDDSTSSETGPASTPPRAERGKSNQKPGDKENTAIDKQVAEKVKQYRDLQKGKIDTKKLSEEAEKLVKASIVSTLTPIIAQGLILIISLMMMLFAVVGLVVIVDQSCVILENQYGAMSAGELAFFFGVCGIKTIVNKVKQAIAAVERLRQKGIETLSETSIIQYLADSPVGDLAEWFSGG